MEREFRTPRQISGVRSSVERVTEGELGCNCVLVSSAFFPYSYPTLTQGHSLSFPPSPFIFALFPDCLGTRQVVARFGVLLTRGNLAAVSPFSAPVRSDPFTGWVPPNRLGAPPLSRFPAGWTGVCTLVSLLVSPLPRLSIGLLRYLFSGR